jgi:hypothetical protein
MHRFYYILTIFSLIPFFIKEITLKRYFRKNIGYGELVNVYRKSLTILQNLNCSSDKDFKCVKTKCLKPMLFNGGFKIYLPDHPEPQ